MSVTALRLHKRELVEAVAIASKFSSARSPVGYMQNLNLFWDKGQLFISAAGSGLYCRVPVDCIGSPCEVIVNCASFAKTVGLLSGDEVFISVGKNKITLSGDGPSVSIPVFTQWVSMSVGQHESFIEVDPKDFVKCLSAVETIKSTVELKFSGGIRLKSDGDGVLHFSASTSKNAAFSWCSCSEATFDAILFRNGVAPVKKAAEKMGNLRISATDQRLIFDSGNMFCIADRENGGVPPILFSVAKGLFAAAHDWRVDKGKLVEFLRHSLAIASPEANGIWLEPTDSGLNCRYTGLADGTNSVDFNVDATCEYHVPGDACEGKPAYVSCRLLAPAVAALSDENFLLRSCDERNIIVEAANGVIAIAQMSAPPKGKTA